MSSSWKDANEEGSQQEKGKRDASKMGEESERAMKTHLLLFLLLLFFLLLVIIRHFPTQHNPERRKVSQLESFTHEKTKRVVGQRS